MTSNYDEDLAENPFLKSFQNDQKILFENSLKKEWIIAVPRLGSFSKTHYTDMDYLNHVLVPIYEHSNTQEKSYKTLGNQKVIIKGKMITIFSKESNGPNQIPILFSETFYTDQDVPYDIICINSSLTSPISNGKDVYSKVFSLNSVEECTTFLWKFVAKTSTREKVDQLINLTRSQIQSLENVEIDKCFALIRNLYVAVYNIITSQKTYSKISSKNENIQNSLKLALEMYLCHSLHKSLLWAISDLTAEKNEEVNTATRRYQFICASKSGIRFDVCENIPRAKKEINSLRYVTTPMGLCECIRKIVAELSNIRQANVPSVVEPDQASSPENSKNDMSASLRSSLLVTSDDLLSALIFLIIKSDINNWYTLLEFGVKFRFASCSRDDEYQYYLTTLEAALEHIRGMGSGINEDCFLDTSDHVNTESMVYDDRPSQHWTRVIDSSRLGNAASYQMNQTRHLFQLIESGQTSAVREQIMRTLKLTRPELNEDLSIANRRTVGPSNFLQATPQSTTTTTATNLTTQHNCHPLCSCKSKKLPGKHSTQSLIEGFRRKSDVSATTATIQSSNTYDCVTSSRNSSVDNSLFGYSSLIGRPGGTCIHDMSNISKTLSLTSCDDRGWNALHVAAWYGQLEIVQLLLDYGIDVDYCSLEGDSALHLASKRGHQDVMFKLLDAYADASLVNGVGNNPLHIAAEYAYISCVSTLAYYGTLRQSNAIDINAVNSSGNTALHIAAIWGYEKVVKCLLDNGANALLKNLKTKQPHELACTKKLQDLIKSRALEQEKELIKLTTNQISLQTNLVNKSHYDDDSLSMIKHKTMLKQKHNIEKWSNMKINKLNDIRSTSLPSNQDSIDRKIEKLLKVVADGDLQMLKFLLEITDDDENPNYSILDANKKLCHPLCQCSKCSPFQKYIIKSNNQHLTVNSCNREGFYCLHIAAIHDRSTIAKFLLQYGADPNCRTNKLHLIPLHFAAIYGSIKVLSILLANNSVNINHLDKKLNTALFYACAKRKIDVVDLLLKMGAKVNNQNHRGNTALHESVKYNYRDVVDLLLEHGAQIHLENNQGLTPLDLAQDLQLYVYLKKFNRIDPNKRDFTDTTTILEDTVVQLTGSWSKEHDNEDSLSVCSENSVASSKMDSESIVTNNPLFEHYETDLPDNDYSRQNSNSHPSEMTIDPSLLERIDVNNTKYNYRLMFKDPNSPSLSSNNSC